VEILIAGLLLFLMPHLLRELRLRDRLVNALPSMGAYKALYSLVALVGLILIIVGKSRAPFVMIWQPLYELRFITNIAMIPATILVVAGNLPPGHLRQHLRNPMLLGVAIWGAAHLWSNGDLASMLLFGAFMLWASGKFVTGALRTKPPTQHASLLWDGLALIVGFVIYVLISIYHGQLFGVGLSFG